VTRSFVNLDDIARRARRRLPRLVADFIEGGAEDEATVAANRAAFGHWELVPRVLVDVSKRRLTTSVLDHDLSLPVGLGPAGLARLAHVDGEVAAARAAGEAGTVYTLSTGSSRTIEEVAEAARGAVWFQLYLWRDRDVIAGLVERARAAGYGALVLTVDVPVIGRRERDLRNGMTLPPRLTRANVVDMLRHPRWLAGLVRGSPLTFANFVDVPGRGRSAVELGQYVNVEMMNPSATWEMFSWLRTIWPGPLAIKGVLHRDDAVKAVDLGANGVIVSNHGGRQLDGAVAALDALPAVAEAVNGRADVLLDGGIRRGTDVVKALALGAQAVLIGRPYVLGLGADGAAGVAAALEVLRNELDRALALVGCPDVGLMNRDFLVRSGSGALA
jgi:isopentenyl diphosphate isomerase/L-lactate dehydrogenase-like FMN-dependent dehydrogenase